MVLGSYRFDASTGDLPKNAELVRSQITILLCSAHVLGMGLSLDCHHPAVLCTRLMLEGSELHGDDEGGLVAELDSGDRRTKHVKKILKVCGTPRLYIMESKQI